MSKDYENKIAKEMHRATPPSVRTYRCGYSGNNAMPQPDVLVTTYNGNKALELKGPIHGNYCYVEEEDLEQLVECENANTEVYLVVKFAYSEPVVVRHYGKMMGRDDWNEKSVAERFAAVFPKAFRASVTSSGRLSLKDPRGLDWQPSNGGREDTTAILDALGLPHEGSKNISDAQPKNPWVAPS